MKAVLLLVLFIVATHSAFANESSFHWLQWKCQAEDSAQVETTPQSPPLDVDDPGTPGCNSWEINVLFDGDLSRNASNWELPLLDINYGIGDNLQLKYELPYLNSQADDLAFSGVGTSKAGIKYKFFDDEKTELEMAVYPQVDFLTPGSQAVAKGLVSPGTITTLPFMVSRNLGEVLGGELAFTTEVGYNLSSRDDTANFISGAAGLGLPLSGGVSMMGELSTEQAITISPDGTRQALLKADLGAMGMINKALMIYGAVGQSLYASDQLNHTYVLAGIRLLTTPSAARE